MGKIARLGIVGPGIIWRGTHKPVLMSLTDRCAIVAVCARDPAKLEAAAKDHPGAKRYTDYRDLVRDAGIDAVVVTTPIPLNAPVTIAALKTGKDVFVEKPFAMSCREGRRIVDLEKRTGRRVYILEQMLYTDALARVKGVIADGAIGKLAMFDRAIHGYIGVGGDPWGYGDTKWRVNGQFPLGPLFDGGIHEIAVQTELFGPVRSVCAAGQKFRREHGDFDNVVMMFGHDRGVIGSVTHSGYLGGNRNYFNIRGTEGLIVMEYWRMLIEPRSGKARQEVFADSAEAYFKGLHTAMWLELLDRWGMGKPARYTTAMSLRDVATLEAIERAIKTGRTVAVNRTRPEMVTR